MGNSKDKFLELQEREAMRMWEENEKRMQVIAQNGNNGYHYEQDYNYEEVQRPFIPQAGIVKPIDSVVDSVVKKYQQRSETGIRKYGTTMDRTDLNLSEWLTHLQEELMDALLYLESAKMCLQLGVNKAMLSQTDPLKFAKRHENKVV